MTLAHTKTVASDDRPVIQAILNRFHEWEERLMRRMLCAWNPALGEPTQIRRPQKAADTQIDFPFPYRMTVRITTDLVGLGIVDPETGFIDVRIFAIDHIGEDGEVLPPIPDRGMLAIFESRMTGDWVAASRRTEER